MDLQHLGINLHHNDPTSSFSKGQQSLGPLFARKVVNSRTWPNISARLLLVIELGSSPLLSHSSWPIHWVWWGWPLRAAVWALAWWTWLSEARGLKLMPPRIQQHIVSQAPIEVWSGSSLFRITDTTKVVLHDLGIWDTDINNVVILLLLIIFILILPETLPLFWGWVTAEITTVVVHPLLWILWRKRMGLKTHPKPHQWLSPDITIGWF